MSLLYTHGRRLQAMVRGQIQLHDKMSDLEEKLQEKVALSRQKTEERRLAVHRERERRMQMYQARSDLIRNNKENAYEVKMAALRERAERAMQLSNAEKDRTRAKMFLQSKMTEMRLDRHRQSMLQAARASDYDRSLVEGRLARPPPPLSY